jgi:hypothetical protein
MSDPVKRNGIVAAAAGLGEKIVGGLSGPFLALIVLNIAFLLCVLWFVRAESALRVQIVEKVLDICAADMAGRYPPGR